VQRLAQKQYLKLQHLIGEIHFLGINYFLMANSLAHDVGVQLRNKNGLTLDFLLFLVILKASGRKTSQN